MENPAANQLPDVGSLPDGFFEGTTDSIAPVTPSNEREKPLDRKENRLLDYDFLIDSSNEGKMENVQKLRTFPVPLSDKDGYEASGESADVSDDGCMEQTGNASTLEPDSSSFASAVSLGCNDEKEKVRAVGQSSEKWSSAVESTNGKETQLLENQKNRKETLEANRKSSKRSFTTEEEFLEFTLKYQQVVAERDAAITVKDKPESLCRELQRQNKLLMDECRRVSEEGQNLRLGISTRFQDAIKDVSHKLEEQKGECLSQLKENEMLRNKLKQIADQYTLSQQQFSQELKQKTLELQIAELKNQQNEEKLAHEQTQTKLYEEKISQLLETEKSLRSQLKSDGEKFQQFQDSLFKSNEVFETFKHEIEKMAKLTKDLKKENNFLESKCERFDFTLVELIEERERMKKELEKTKKQKEKLESLCRSLQAERKQNSNGNGKSEFVKTTESS